MRRARHDEDVQAGLKRGEEHRRNRGSVREEIASNVGNAFRAQKPFDDVCFKRVARAEQFNGFVSFVHLRCV
jgi:hypothetical protein